MRVRVDFEVFPLYLDLTPSQIEALDDEYSWQPFIDEAYDEIETHLMSTFTIEDVKEMNH